MMRGISYALMLTELLIVFAINDVSAFCSTGRIDVANAGELKIVDIYFKLDSMLCSGKPVYKCESKPDPRFIYWDLTLNNWAVSDRFCDPGTDQQILKSSTTNIDYPDEVSTWYERYPKGYFMNPYVKMTCVSEEVPMVLGGAECGTHEFLLSGVTNTNLDVNGHYYRDGGAACIGTGTRSVYKRGVPASPDRYLYYVAGPPGLWAIGPRRCDTTGDDMYLRTYSTARDWEYTKKTYWEEQPQKDKNRHEPNTAITFDCLPPGCYEWGPWVSQGGPCKQVGFCDDTWVANCESPCGGCGMTPSNRNCVVGTMAPGAVVQGQPDPNNPSDAPCNVDVKCDFSIFAHKYQFIKEKFTEEAIHAYAYGVRYCCYDYTTSKPLAKAVPCHTLYS